MVGKATLFALLCGQCADGLTLQSNVGSSAFWQFDKHHGSASQCKAEAEPTYDYPFFFFHIPKVGGSSMRSIIWEYSERFKKTSLIPEYNKTMARDANLDELVHNPDCPYNIYQEPMACYYQQQTDSSVVFAGHFYLSLAEQVTRQRAEQGMTDYSCLVIVRHPIDRVISAYGHFMDAKYGPFETLSLDMQKGIATEVGGNIILWVLGGNSRFKKGEDGDVVTNEGGDMTTAKAAIDHCFVGVTEDWEASQVMMAKAIPWLIADTDEAANTMENVRGGHVAFSDLSAYARDGLTKHLQPDFELYEHALNKFDLQRQCDQD